MKETITIKNFGGLKDAVIPLNSINIFIGKQASGKSVTAKLIYFFKRHLSDIFIDIINEKTEEESNKITLSRFAEYFPREVWEGNPFTVKYELGNEKIKVEYSQRNDLQLNYSSKIKNLFSIARKLEGVRKSKEETGDLFSHVNLYHEYQKIVDKQFGEKVFSEQRFVPAGRSYFAHVENNVFSILSTKQTIDPFLISFGADYQLLKTVLDKAKSNFKDGQQNELLYSQFVDNLISDILVGNYTREDNKDYIVHKDKRKINVTFSSSGQQETLPLLVVLKALTKLGVNNSCVTTYIEEPEAHLFPSAQKKIIELISAVYNITSVPLRFVITTHSPYILTAFNNLLQAGHLLENGADKKKLFKIVPEFEVLKCGELNAFAFQDGGVVSLIDEETGLISADLLDQVSEEIAVQFDELLEL